MKGREEGKKEGRERREGSRREERRKQVTWGTPTPLGLVTPYREGRK
jgi:hypothetical protein